ncbi:permease [Candidatus Peregrinibacteria bacterium CG22_combo_CG10-13_8_21_14_all_44_10]|nr:MAG: permease [Candidatus Peregrinibacteria bacterium CG2_30_44_17]PIP66497.1 MAG: permease [Candidatus Peregrinibacteria bacterium CG22_combo_CG10-13_8_21_14_all_44_10]PIS03862.1 MAG: permease [Candidatus Peregrinibacteria bacterium CG10_big_fil_rev_8_21_14_0_10_44_7]PIX80285.1 MAG: permease [Candidatus Peregrinibacteria bacterium CG_4_10_14_3_um_filter_44_21]PJB89206.1 MAG: permease [Candidatus Peregrinibacteria bacterium CG_4_9_14_0_8_um_filter_44_15]
METGLALAVFGAAIAAVCGGIGSSIGVGLAGQAGAGVTTEKPELFGKILLMQALPGTQGIYGFLGALLILMQVGLLGDEVVVISTQTGLQFLAASLPVGLASLFSGIQQGKVSATGLKVIAKNPANAGKAVIMSAMVETYAVLGLLVSVLLIFGIKVS